MISNDNVAGHEPTTSTEEYQTEQQDGLANSYEPRDLLYGNPRE